MEISWENTCLRLQKEVLEANEKLRALERDNGAIIQAMGEYRTNWINESRRADLMERNVPGGGCCLSQAGWTSSSPYRPSG